MRSASVDIVNKLGLHARAASKLVSLAKSFACRIELRKSGGPPADAKSIMAVLMLEAAYGAALEVRCSGDDEAEALAAVQALVADRFGEGE